MIERLLIIAAVLALAALAYGWWARRQGQVRRVEQAGHLSAAQLGAPRGHHATLVQFSTPMCAKCPPTAQLLTRVAAESEHVTHIEIDASEHLDLAREFDIMRTPTTLVLDGDGAVVARMSGAPHEQQVREALAAVPRSDTDYSI